MVKNLLEDDEIKIESYENEKDERLESEEEWIYEGMEKEY